MLSCGLEQPEGVGVDHDAACTPSGDALILIAVVVAQVQRAVVVDGGDAEVQRLAAEPGAITRAGRERWRRLALRLELRGAARLSVRTSARAAL